MTDEDKIAATALAGAKQKSLELLYDYTKFHIGVYLTLAASYLTAATANIGGTKLLMLNPVFVWPTVLFIALAGLAGGVIVSSLTQWLGESSTEFLASEVGLWDWKSIHFRARTWTHIEHTSFWLGLACAVLSFVPR